MSEIAKKSEEQKDSEAEVDGFRKDLGPFVVAAETTRMPMIFTNAKEPDNPIVFANDAFLALTGYERKEVMAQRFTFLLARGADPEAVAQVKAAFDGTSDSNPVIHYRRKDSSKFWASLYISPVRSESGEVLQHFVSFVDFTKHQEEQSHTQMLIDELDHRIKNTLQAVQSIVSQAFQTTSDPKVIRESIESRLFALSRSHDLLMSENWVGAGLLDLVKAAVEPFRVVNGREERCVITGTNVHLPPRATLALGIAFHELAINAVKFGALSTEKGSISIAWTIKPTPEGNRLILYWREKGGPQIPPPIRKGFGSRVLERGLPHEMEGTAHLDFGPDGLVYSIDVPAPRGVREE